MSTKIIAWNINGMNAQLKKNDLFELIEKSKPNIICFGETKVSCNKKTKQTKEVDGKIVVLSTLDLIKEELNEKIKGYKYRYWSPCLVKNGYSGTAIFSKKKPLSVNLGMGQDGDDDEGRMITLEFKDYYLVHVYTPNSGDGLVRLKYRVETWDKNFRKYCRRLQKIKPIIVCGDLNVANEEIDIANPKGNKKRAGFTEDERNSFKKTLDKLDLIDTFRYQNPDEVKYSYWTYFGNARKNNKGWRIDYFLVSDKLKSKIKKSDILTDVMGSDHAPIELILKK